MEVIRSEDTLIFYGLTPRVTKIASVIKALKQFFSKKKQIDASDRFNIILFLENAPHYLEGFTLNPEHVLNTLKSKKKKLVRANIGGGIFVAITFIIDVFKKIGDKCFRLIILTDDGSPKITKEHASVLENLIEKVKDMPFFIDVVQITTKDDSEDVELKKLAEMCGGVLQEIFNVSYLPIILDNLVVKRDDTREYDKKKEKYKIPWQNEPFFENLAEAPAHLEREETCSVCFKKDEKGLVQCSNCQTIAHETCWAQWAKTSNIGMPNVFRCHNCYNLLKLDTSLVETVQSSIIQPEDEIKVQVLDLHQYLESLEPEDGPRIIKIEDYYYS